MSMNDQKREKLGTLSTEALRNILDTLGSPEDKEPSPEYPLGGQVSIEGVGAIPVGYIRSELESRVRNNSDGETYDEPDEPFPGAWV